jgi:ABC-type transport system substrate-binding protein
VTTGNPDQGFEGYRFVGYNLYDGLLLWDLSKSDKPSEIRPGLATAYEIDPNDHKRWIVHLRHDVTWHDGCKFSADDVVWNFQMRMDEKAPNFSTQQFTYTRAFLSNVKAVTKIDDYTVALENNFVESLFPYTLSYVLMISPCRAKEVNYDWAAYALHPSGTGPYKFDKVVPISALNWCPTPTGTSSASPRSARAESRCRPRPAPGPADRPGRRIRRPRPMRSRGSNPPAQIVTMFTA